MIKTLRITGVVTAVLAGICLVFLVVFSARGDKRIKELSKIPGVIEEFKSTRGSKANVNRNERSPLVVQAQLFAMYLNPPRKPEPRPKQGITRITPPEKEVVVSAKFRVVLTSYSEENPEMSRALISEPGSGLRWVMQSSTVGHLQIEQIQDGVVIAKGGEETFRVGIEAAAPAPSLIQGSAPVSTASSSRRPPTPVNRTPPGIPSAVSRSIPPQPQMKEGQNAMMEMMREQMKGMRNSDKTDKSPSKDSSTISREMMLKLMTQFGADASRISELEAKRLDDLGKELEDIKQDPKGAKSGSGKIEPGLPSPTSPSKRSSR